MPRYTAVALVLAGSLTLACTPKHADIGAAPGPASATIRDAQGDVVGNATLTETSAGVLISASVSGLGSGTHAIHIHTVGKCEPPFSSAGGHFNPGDMHHGFRDPAGPHAGDLPNISIPAGGALSFDLVAPHATLSAGPNSLLDADGSALVIHAAADDYATDPSGNAGARIACGVISLR